MKVKRWRTKGEKQFQAYHGTSPDNWGILLHKEPYRHTLYPKTINGNHFLIWNYANRKLLSWTAMEDGWNLAVKKTLISISSIRSNFNKKEENIFKIVKKTRKTEQRKKSSFHKFLLCEMLATHSYKIMCWEECIASTSLLVMYWIPSNPKINEVDVY